MNAQRKCAACGVVLPEDATDDVCPMCLLEVGRHGSSSGDGAGSEDPTLPPSESSSADDATLPPHEGVKSESLSSGTKVRYFGDYELLEEIARGGMGVVYKARQVSLDRTVALKMILSGQLASEQDIQRFLTEAQAAASLQHPNIVAIHEVGEHEGQHYFSMDLVQGWSLADVAARNPLSPRRAGELVKQLAEAIQYAHDHDTLHRDLKPSNILIDASGQPHVTDFGLAKRIESDSGLTGTGQVLGTPSYMPPEQAAGRHDQIGPASDVYSLGAILYELLTGRPPFRAANPLDTLLQVLENEPVSPRLLNPSVPKDLETITLKCLNKERQLRYATASQLSADLGRFLNEEPILARPIGTVRRVWRWTRRQRRSVAVSMSTLAVCLVLLIGGLIGWYGYQQWQLGFVSLLTNARGQHLTAEVMDERSRVVSRHTIPTQNPIPLKSDAYRVRVSGAGRLSKDFHLCVGHGTETQYLLNLDGTQLWATIQVERTFRLIDLDGRADVILLGDAGISRLDGRSTEHIWSLDPNSQSSEHAIFNEATGFRWSWWQHSVSFRGASPPWRRRRELGELSGAGQFDRRPELVSPAPDLDGDGVGDLVLAAQHQAWLLAVSGKQGTPLWLAARGSDEQQRRLSPEEGVESATLAASVLGDVNGDQVVDLLATFVDAGPAREGGQSAADMWVEAVCGKTGETIWRFDLDQRWFQLAAGRDIPDDFAWFFGGDTKYSWYDGLEKSGLTGRFGSRSSKLHVPAAAQQVTLHDRPSVMLLAGTHVVLLDPQSGKPLEPPQDLGFAPVCPPKAADLNQDGNTDLVLIEQRTNPNGQRGSIDPIQLVAWSPADGRPLWSRECNSLWGLYDYWHDSPDWPLFTDASSDGSAEILVPDGGELLEQNILGEGGLSMLDGASGNVIWTRRLPSIHQQLDRFVIGPDVDRDGYRDIFVATQYNDRYVDHGFQEENLDLYLDALSGKDGHPLWHARQRLEALFTIGAMRWWQAGPDGWPQLLIPVFLHPGLRSDTRSNEPHMFQFSSRDGRLNAIGQDMECAQLADGDGDGVVDLYTFCPDSFEQPDHGGALDAVRGLPTDVWRPIGPKWDLAGDLDNDGVTDFVGRQSAGTRGPSSVVSDGLIAVSGKTGQLLWEKRPIVFDRHFSVRADLNGDGSPDLLLTSVSESGNIGLNSHTRPLSALSGRTGQWLWAVDAGVGSAKDWHRPQTWFADCVDLNSDERPEVVLVQANDWGLPSSSLDVWLAVIAGRDGEVIWKKRVFPNAHRLSFPEAEFIPAQADLDADGVTDLILAAETPASEGAIALHAFSGRDGQVLWQRPLSVAKLVDRGRLDAILPNPVCGDVDGDGQSEVVLLDWIERTMEDGLSQRSARLLVLNGRNGQPKYPAFETPVRTLTRRGWTIVAGDRQKPVLVQLAEKRQAIILALEPGPPASEDTTVVDGEAIDAFVIGGDAQQVSRFSLASNEGNWTRPAHAYDTNGDGRDELVFFGDGAVTLCALPEGDVLWKWPLPGASERHDADLSDRADAPREVKVLDISRDNADQPAVIAIQAGESVYGLAATDGEVLWRSEGDRVLSGREPVTPIVSLIPPSQPRQPPKVLYQYPQRFAGTSYTYGVYRHASFVGGLGERPSGYSEDAPRREVVADRRYHQLRRLPWARGTSTDGVLLQGRRTLFWSEALFWGLLFAIVLITLPAALLRHLLTRPRFTIRMLSLIPAVIGLALAVAVARPVFLPLSLHSIANRFLLGLSMLPLMAIVGKWCQLAVTLRWRQLLGWFVFLSIVAGALATAMLGDDNSRRGGTYSLEGWYLIFLPAAYITGALLLLIKFALVTWQALGQGARYARNRLPRLGLWYR